MIVGIGTDIVQIKRIEKLLLKYGQAFQNRILSFSEIQKLEKIPLNKHASFLSKRFAAKEAISKALGTGITHSLEFKDIIILNDEKGKPYVKFTPEKSNNIQHFEISLSLADDYPIAVAFAVVSK